ncbi:Aldo/keto reductase [Eremomyces bilateralis CBS 781.70]|uniref:Aldo/keto reductase n=1 Tax=Eremomyces bilateralis CBS 781.70 TaxID=1392243 RepID=A0A6G1G8D8_9PEZI|nr:Aldo/keto reductase [Eremomyces bilateralis CBS 781.70]KAF1814252.1 Aldo/keto reductase [Eremomyces bilateralis CBS 781.70]
MVQVAGRNVGPIGFGLMGMTWRPESQPFEESIKTMRAALARGANLWNGGELYGTPERNSLHLLNAYFTKYPEDASKVVIGIKGGLKPGQMALDGSPANVSRSIEECLKVFDGKCKLDIFECGRVDPNVPVEVSVGEIKRYIDAGKVGGLSLSEVSADTIRRAAKICKIDCVEVEFSLFSLDILSNGIAETCAGLGIPIVAYSPLSRGFLTGQLKTYDDVKPFLRETFPRFSEENFPANMKLVREVEEIAKRKNCAISQVAIGWVLAQSGRNGLPTIIPIPGATTEARVAENTTAVTLTEEDLAAIDELLKNFVPAGGRYGGFGAALMNG